MSFRDDLSSAQASRRAGNSPTTSHKLIILLAVSLLFSAAFSYILSRQPIILIRSDHFSRWYATNKLVHIGTNKPGITP
jgi:hypothetical protein